MPESKPTKAASSTKKASAVGDSMQQGSKSDPNIKPPAEDPDSAVSKGKALTGGKGDDVKAVTHERRTGTSDQSQPNRMVAENNRDLDAISDTGQHRQGNALGVQPDAAVNFARDAKAKAKALRAEADKLDDEAKYWLSVANNNKKESA